MNFPRFSPTNQRFGQVPGHPQLPGLAAARDEAVLAAPVSQRLREDRGRGAEGIGMGFGIHD